MRRITIIMLIGLAVLTGSFAFADNVPQTLKEKYALRLANPKRVFDWSHTIYGKTISAQDTYFDVGDVAIRDFEEFKMFLSCFPNLTHVDMYETKIVRKRIDELVEAFPHIQFGWSMKVADHIIRTDATAFSTLHSDKSTEHSSKDFEVLKYCKNLKALDLGHNKITTLTFLDDLLELRILILARNRITDITPLRNLDKLEYLELFMNKITDISPLSNLNRLIDLELTRNQITDYSPLYNLPSLERLWLNRSGKAIAQDALRNALPSCYIDFDSNPTQGGWREHERYDVVKAIFAEGLYREWQQK